MEQEYDSTEQAEQDEIYAEWLAQCAEDWIWN